MPELRQNPATKEWVIIATERAKRPEDFKAGTCDLKSQTTDNCPFCPGHENMTPEETFALRPKNSKPNSPGWEIRVTPNKFPALFPNCTNKREKIKDLFLSMDGLGTHEVIIDTPNHDKNITSMTKEEVEKLFFVYKQRYSTLAKNSCHEMIILFKNHGCNAGTSLSHPHSQIIATPVTPQHIRHRIEEAMRYFDDNGKCVYCNIIDVEKELGKRVVMESENFIVIESFASMSPFETWILPKKHCSSFDEICDDQCKELGSIIQNTLKKINKALNEPDYNYILFSSPCQEHGLEYYHWHFKIFPRVTSTAGFEMGSGIYINPVIPEEATKYLRKNN